MTLHEHDNWAHGVRPGTEGTPMECPYMTTAEWYERRNKS